MSDEEANTLRIENDQLRHDAAHVLNELDWLRAERDELVAALEAAVVVMHIYGAANTSGCKKAASLVSAALLARIRAAASEPDHDRPPGSQRG